MFRAIQLPYLMKSLDQVIPRSHNKLCFAQISSSQSCNNFLKLDDINQRIRRMEYAVRGPLVMRAHKLSEELREGAQKPFKSVISANIGDCQAMNQKPITFIRQVLACTSDTSLLKSSNYPNDVKERAREILFNCGGNSIGSYTESCGLDLIRQHIAKYIEDRDGGVKSDPNNIILTSGATEGVKIILAFINETRRPGIPVGVMIPIPQYPLYSASLCELGIQQVNYYLDEENNWRLNVSELKRAYDENVGKCDIRSIVVINPGNPTGSVLSEENIVEILDFADEHKLMVIADEVYQHNVYDVNSRFHSFKKVMSTANKTSYGMELVSLMSSSKGFMGECGLRGGYCEISNFDDDVKAILYKGITSWLCPSVLGQISMDCVVKPPRVGEESYDLFEKEKSQVLNDLKRKAKLVADTFNSVDGVQSNQVSGAMYAFPRLDLPPKAISKAKSLNYSPDFYYAMQFLERYGVCVVPGSGFGQLPGTYHFRTTILPQPDVFEDLMDRFRKFHNQFLEEFS